MASKLPLVLDPTALVIQQMQSSDIVSSAALGTGTANATTFLRGDGAWAPPSVTGADYSINGAM